MPEKRGHHQQAACKPNSVKDGHSSRRRIAAALKRPTRRFPLHATAKAVRMEDPRWRAGQARRAAIWVWLRIPPYLVLLRVGFTLPPSVAAGAVRSYRTFSPLPCAVPAKSPCMSLESGRNGVGGIFSVALAVSKP
jgi:hypothetical protein